MHRRTFLVGATAATFARPAAAQAVRAKADILALARQVRGRGDPDKRIEAAFRPLVERLLAVAPQPPVRQRIGALAGVWQQIWGPYDYRGDSRGVDPALKTDEIYQAVFAEGFYYNVSPLIDKPKERIGLLRGNWTLSNAGPDILQVRFTAYPGNATRPAGRPIWTLAADAERRTLPDPISIVPRLIVRSFFGGGALREIYTDDTLRLTYGSDSPRDRSDERLYVMTRVA